jgi:hypothetical protein
VMGLLKWPDTCFLERSRMMQILFSVCVEWLA